MSWFGGGSKKPAEEKLQNFDTYPDHQSSFPESGSSTSMGPGGASMSGFEQKVLAAQQNALVQAVMFKLTEIAFEKCVQKPSTQLTAVERNCIAAVSTKYLETSQVVITGLSPLMGQQR